VRGGGAAGTASVNDTGEFSGGKGGGGGVRGKRGGRERGGRRGRRGKWGGGRDIIWCEKSWRRFAIKCMHFVIRFFFWTNLHH